ncbi:MAG: class I SAM-dependent methyltransferase [Chloroflexi bacterium]|nr:class I SAM-dependent methyltransferase [Chloroflexota bacterium]
MPDDYDDIYLHHAARYQELVSFEDYEGRLQPAISAVHALDGADIVECGAGTGRVTRLVAPAARRLLATDGSPAMLRLAVQQLSQAGHTHCFFAAADHRALPFPDACADFTLEGWAFGHLAVRHYEPTFAAACRAIDEMQRVLRPGGTMLLIETLGTGYERPTPPSDELAHFFAYLEDHLGFQHTWVRTDFRFPTQAQGEALLEFFFGQSLADRFIPQDDVVILPECTGLWWRTA